MAVRLEGSIKRYVGYSSDTKPDLEPRDAGSSFLEEDSGLISRWTGRTWTLPEKPAEERWLQAIYGELVRIRERIEGEIG